MGENNGFQVVNFFNSLPNDKKLEDICSPNGIIASDIVENNVVKGENAGYKHVLLFKPCFQTASFPGIVWLEVNTTSSIKKESKL